MINRKTLDAVGDPGALFDALIARSDLRKFADSALRSRFVATMAGLSYGIFGNHRQAAVQQIESVLNTRLALARDLDAYPEIASEPIERPVFVVGYARTGTTVMHSLLGEDPASRIPLAWHGWRPSPPPGRFPESVPQRILEADTEVSAYIRKVPDILKPHPYWDRLGHAPIEDEELFALNFQHPYPTRYFDIPARPDSFDVPDPVQAFRFHRQLLQHLQWRSPRKRWVCKGVMHQFCLDALWSVYPDAICIWTHRDPLETVPSTLGILDILYGSITGNRTTPAIAQAMVNGLAAGFEAVLDMPSVHDPRGVHVRFRDLVSNPIEVMNTLYQKQNMAWTPDYETRIAAWRTKPENISNRHGEFKYSLERFGLDRAELQDRFARYRERFSVA